MSLIELKNITFSYSEEESSVFSHFNFSVEQGKCISVEGDNGTGKTTLFRILNGLSFLQEGQYLFDETEITEKYLRDNLNAKRFHKRIGYLFQNPDIMLFNASVYDEIAFGVRQMGLDEAQVDQRVLDCVRIFHLESLLKKAPYHLSGGQKKRVALASVMALNPEVLILDEPFTGLDAHAIENLMTFLLELKKSGKTIIIATHNPEVKEKLADDVLVLKHTEEIYE